MNPLSDCADPGVIDMDNPSGGSNRSRKDVKKASYYVWFLGARECGRLRGHDDIKCAVKYLVDRERDNEVTKVTLQVNNKGLKIIQNGNHTLSPSRKSSGKISTSRMEEMRHFIPDHCITCVLQADPPNDDVVGCILLLYNPVTKCPVHVHVYRFDSRETAEILQAQLSVLINRPENQRRFAEIEARLQTCGVLCGVNQEPPPQPDGRSIQTSDSADSIGSSSSSSGVMSGEREKVGKESTSRVPGGVAPHLDDRIITLYDSLAAELREKLAVNRQTSSQNEDGSSGSGAKVAPISQRRNKANGGGERRGDTANEAGGNVDRRPFASAVNRTPENQVVDNKKVGRRSQQDDLPPETSTKKFGNADMDSSGKSSGFGSDEAPSSPTPRPCKYASPEDKRASDTIGRGLADSRSGEDWGKPGFPDKNRRHFSRCDSDPNDILTSSGSSRLARISRETTESNSSSNPQRSHSGSGSTDWVRRREPEEHSIPYRRKKPLAPAPPVLTSTNRTQSNLAQRNSTDDEAAVNKGRTRQRSSSYQSDDPGPSPPPSPPLPRMACMREVTDAGSPPVSLPPEAASLQEPKSHFYLHTPAVRDGENHARSRYKHDETSGPQREARTSRNSAQRLPSDDSIDGRFYRNSNPSQEFSDEENENAIKRKTSKERSPREDNHRSLKTSAAESANFPYTHRRYRENDSLEHGHWNYHSPEASQTDPKRSFHDPMESKRYSSRDEDLQRTSRKGARPHTQMSYRDPENEQAPSARAPLQRHSYDELPRDRRFPGLDKATARRIDDRFGPNRPSSMHATALPLPPPPPMSPPGMSNVMWPITNREYEYVDVIRPGQFPSDDSEFEWGPNHRPSPDHFQGSPRDGVPVFHHPLHEAPIPNMIRPESRRRNYPDEPPFPRYHYVNFDYRQPNNGQPFTYYY